MAVGKVNCDTRVIASVKIKLESIAKEMSETTGLKIKRSDVQRAAFNRYIQAYDDGLLVEQVQEDFDGKAN